MRDDEGNEHPLTASEFGLLKVFAANPKRVLSRERLLELANARDAEAFDRAVDLRIMRIRRKIEPDPTKPAVIRTIRGGGYLFSPAGEKGRERRPGARKQAITQCCGRPALGLRKSVLWLCVPASPGRRGGATERKGRNFVPGCPGRPKSPPPYFPYIEIPRLFAPNVSSRPVRTKQFGGARNHFPLFVQTSRNVRSLTLWSKETPLGCGATGS